MATFLSWGLAIECTAVRPLVVLPLTCEGLSRDECLAVSLVAAAQHQHCPALRACAAALLGTADDGRVFETSRILAGRLADSGAHLDADRIVEAARFEARGATAPTSTPVHGRAHGRRH